jgi:hypothetical protein
MKHPWIFVLAPAAALPESPCSLDALAAAQRQGPQGGLALRLFRQGKQWDRELAALPLDGGLSGESRRSSDGTQLLCDAIIPHIEPQHLWLGVYQAEAADHHRFQCLDRFPLTEASNDTCWFYPTHDGTYLSWERDLQLVLAPGKIADPPAEAFTIPYVRSNIAVLWSLLADDSSLSCVGLTYGGQRLDWPLQAIQPEAVATWSRFCIDTQAETSLVVQDSQTIFPPSSLRE